LVARKRSAKGTDAAGEEGDTPAPLKPLRLKLRTINDVRGELARLYRDGKAGRRDVNDVSKLANVLAILGRLIEGADFERRLLAAEAFMAKTESAWQEGTRHKH
jgi:hypothetical protein